MEYKDTDLCSELQYYQSLPEKARRHYLALEYKKLGRGSQRYLSEVFGCSRKTITKGMKELAASGGKPLDYSFQRKKGGGRKKRVRS